MGTNKYRKRLQRRFYRKYTFSKYSRFSATLNSISLKDYISGMKFNLSIAMFRVVFKVSSWFTNSLSLYIPSKCDSQFNNFSKNNNNSLRYGIPPFIIILHRVVDYLLSNLTHYLQIYSGQQNKTRTVKNNNYTVIQFWGPGFAFKGSDRLCKVVELSMHCFGKLLSNSFERKFDVQNSYFGGEYVFFKLLNSDDIKCKKVLQ